jgi:hypothetical protein
MWESPKVEQYDEGISEDSRRVDINSLEEACCAQGFLPLVTARYTAVTVATAGVR